MSFSAQGYAVLPDLLTPAQLEQARILSRELIDRYRQDPSGRPADAVSVESVTRQHPQRNPGISAEQGRHDPFILGDLCRLQPEFSRILALPPLWERAADLLACPLESVVLHFCNLTRKSARIGPAIGWHRDSINTYFASEDDRTLRLLLPLQDMSAENGGTAVIPGSHHEADETPTDPGQACCIAIPAGSGLAIDSRVVHGGAPNRSAMDRDVLIIQFGVRDSPLRHQADECLALQGLTEVRRFARDQR